MALRVGAALIVLLGLVGPSPGARAGEAGAEKEGEAPSWGYPDLSRLLTAVEVAGRAPDVAEKDARLVTAVAGAYGQSPTPGESVEALAQRTLRARVPSHPKVQDGTWLLALTRRFYLDVAERAAQLARFRRDRRERRWLETKSSEAEKAAALLTRELRVELEGVEGLVELPPRVGGIAPAGIGAKAELVGGKLVVERLPRADFRAGRAPDDPRTRGGALREVYAALRQFDTTARMLGRYDRSWREKRGHVQANLPAAAPALVLNELVRAAREAGVRVVHLLTLDREGEVRELPLHLRSARKKKSVKVGCSDEERMEACAKRVAHARVRGRVLYRVQ